MTQIPCCIHACARKGRRPVSDCGALCHRHALARDWRRFRIWWLWIRQGRPRDIPVVVKEGRILRDPLGRQHVVAWHWDLSRMQIHGDVIDGDLLVAWLVLAYPHTVELTSELL